MLLSTIFKFVNSEISADQFIKEITPEVIEYKKLADVKGSTVRIKILDDVATVFTRENFETSNSFLKNNVIDRYEASYIADCLLLSGSFEKLDDELIWDLEGLVVGLD